MTQKAWEEQQGTASTIETPALAEYMEQALLEAHKALALGEVPVGAVVVVRDRIVGRGHNRSIMANDPTAHAEIEALRQASSTLGNYRLTGASLFVTIEPCLMCAGACINARIATLVFGARDPRTGSVRSLYRILEEPHWNHTVRIVEGILAQQCGDLLQGFFKDKRALQARATHQKPT